MMVIRVLCCFNFSFSLGRTLRVGFEFRASWSSGQPGAAAGPLLRLALFPVPSPPPPASRIRAQHRRLQDESAMAMTSHAACRTHWLIWRALRAEISNVSLCGMFGGWLSRCRSVWRRVWYATGHPSCQSNRASTLINTSTASLRSPHTDNHLNSKHTSPS